MAQGSIRVKAVIKNSSIPVPGARVTIRSSEEGATESYQLVTNAEGQTDTVQFETPPIDLSLDENNTQRPYSLCRVTIEAPGYESVDVDGCQILPDRVAFQIFQLNEVAEGTRETTAPEIIDVPPNTLYGDFPPKIPEDPEKPLPRPPSGLVVLPQPVVPEFIIVHAGVPTDTSAPDYKVKYIDYIKNVASCEIYATWPDSAVLANLYAINSFALNRIYTEWYRGKGYTFDITNSTAYDQAFTYGRNIFDNIDRLADTMFTTYVRRQGAKQPLLTQYCDGKYVSCPQWMTQWGSKYLADIGRAPYEILTNYYGTDIDLVTAEKVSGIPKSYPGYALELGSSGEPVRTIQTMLNRIAQNYPNIPKVSVDGVFGPATESAVKEFQATFNLAQSGEVDYTTWYKISAIYVGVTKIAELRKDESRSVKTIQRSLFRSPVPFNSMINTPVIEYPYC